MFRSAYDKGLIVGVEGASWAQANHHYEGDGCSTLRVQGEDDRRPDWLWPRGGCRQGVETYGKPSKLLRVPCSPGAQYRFDERRSTYSCGLLDVPLDVAPSADLPAVATVSSFLAT